MVNNGLLRTVAQIRDKAPAARRAILDLILEDPDRVLAESFELLARRAHSSVPTVMRTCRDLGFAGLREFKLALAHELALGGSPLHRRVTVGNDSTEEIVTKVTRSAAATVAGVRSQLDLPTLEAAVSAIVGARHVDLFATGITSWFMAQDLQARAVPPRPVGQCLGRLPPAARAAAAAQDARGVVLAVSHVGGLPSLLEAVDIARRQGARVVSLTQPGTPLADHRRAAGLERARGRRDACRHRRLPDPPDRHRGPHRAGRAALRRAWRAATARRAQGPSVTWCGRARTPSAELGRRRGRCAARPWSEQQRASNE